MSLYTSFNIAQQSLLMNQSALNVVSSNISNMNTDGYSKQRINATSSGYMDIVGANKTFQVSAGAQIGDISRYRDAYLDTAYRDQNSNLKYYTELSQMASIIENSMNELSGSGLSDALSQFFTATQTLKASPADSTARVNFVQKAQILCTQFNQLATSFTDKRTSTVGNVTDPQSIYQSKLYGNITDVNNKLDQLAQINDIITKSTQNNIVSSDLLDQRDKVLDELSNYMPVTIVTNSNQSINLVMNGVTLVKGNVANHLDVITGTVSNPTTIQLRNENGEVIDTNLNGKFNSGKLAACLEMGGTETGKLTFQNLLDKVDKMANEFANMMNSIQQYSSGGVNAMGIVYDASGKPTLSDFSGSGGLPPLFSDRTGTSTPINAMNIGVDSAIISDYWKVAAARVDTNIPDWDPKAVGNGENAGHFAAVRNQTIPGLGNMNPESYLTTTVSNMGSAIESIQFHEKAQTSLYNSVNAQRQSAIGVNMDEELVDLVKYQRAYEASARIFNVASSIMEQIVNLGRG